jgi:hypothetical protein
METESKRQEMMDSTIVIQIMVSLAFIMSAVSLKLSIDSVKRSTKFDKLEVMDELTVHGKFRAVNGVSVYDSRLTKKQEKNNEQDS